jgi:hypothetical protein
MIPKLSTFISLRHIAGKKVHYHCKIPKGYKLLGIKAEGNDGIFNKHENDVESIFSFKSLRTPIDIEERKNKLLTPASDDVKITFLDEGRQLVNGLNFYYFKARHKSGIQDLIMMTFLYGGDGFHIEISCGTNSSNFKGNENDYFSCINTIELHEK